MNFNRTDLFEKKDSIPQDCNVVFVSDMFLSDYVGGAELTTQALIDSSPLKVHKIHSKNVTLAALEEGQAKHWIFGNYSGIDINLIPSIIANMKYSILEYDYKYCKYRSPEKHQAAENTPCNCNQEMNGKVISAFMHGAKSLWWMSEKQQNHYFSKFPFLEENKNTVLSSVFDDYFFAKVKTLREFYKDAERTNWIVLGSTSWIKGADDAEQWCKDNNLPYEILWNVPYDEMLDKLAQAKGLVFLPKGGDTCPRVVIEAKLLGCELHLNENVQHKDEIWFDCEDMLDTEAYLYLARNRFWNGIIHDMEYVPTLSGYTTTYNCINQDYPYKESIVSMLEFCDQVVVVDGGSSDGTWETLEEWAKNEPKLVIKRIDRDWTTKRFAVFDGLQKAEARKLCTSEFCWQQDSDEIVHESDYVKIKNMLKEFPPVMQLLSLPVIEYWGGPSKVRMDIFPWKWRLSRNLPHITHGIPNQLRAIDEDGQLYAKLGTDGCDYIDAETFEPIPNASFYTQDVDNARRSGMSNPQHRAAYQQWFQNMIDNVPGVHHYSWFNIGRKIRTYRDYWTKHWLSLYNVSQEDLPENNMFFGKAWSDVSESDINNMTSRLSMEMGGWIFHKLVDFNSPTPWLSINRTHPKIMTDWVMKNRPRLDSEKKLELKNHLEMLLSIKGDDNWSSVRNPANNFSLVSMSFPWGDRNVYQLNTDRKNYENLQQSRGLNITSGDDIDTFVNRAIDGMDDFTDSDRLRMSEILNYFSPKLPEAFCELGFRVPRLQRYISSLGIAEAAGYDIADISVLLGQGLGYNVKKYDLGTCTENLDLSSYDLVVCYHVLEHVENPLLALQTIFNGMKKGAVLHVEIPIEEGTPNIQVAHVYPFHPGDLESALKHVGFTIRKFSVQGHAGASRIERIIAEK